MPTDVGAGWDDYIGPLVNITFLDPGFRVKPIVLLFWKTLDLN